MLKILNGYKKSVIRLQLCNISRNVLQDKFIKNPKSFQNQILDYFQRENKRVRKNDIVSRYDENNLYTKMDKIDTELSLKISQMNQNDIFDVLNTLIKHVPGRLHEFSFFVSSLHYLNNFRKRNQFHPPKDHLQLIYFATLSKNTSHIPNSIISETVNQLTSNSNHNQFTLLESCIILNSCYRSKIPLNSNFLNNTIHCFLNNFHLVLKDQSILIAFLKTFRQHKVYSNEDLLSSLIQALFFNQVLPKYSLTTLAHILIFYSDAKYYHGELLKVISNLALKLIENSSDYDYQVYQHLDNSVRGKDIATFLWAISSLGYAPNLLKSRQFYQAIISRQIHNRIKAGEYENRIEDLIDTALALWMINPEKNLDEPLLKYIFSPKIQKTLNDIREIRYSARWNLLYTCVKIEKQFDWLPEDLKLKKFIKVRTDKQLNERKIFAKLVELLSKHFNVKCEFQIEHLNILGLTVRPKSNSSCKSISIELLDDYVLMSNVPIPTGLMSLKLRLLKKLNNDLIVVSNTDLQCKRDYETFAKKIAILLQE